MGNSHTSFQIKFGHFRSMSGWGDGDGKQWRQLGNKSVQHLLCCNLTQNICLEFHQNYTILVILAHTRTFDCELTTVSQNKITLLTSQLPVGLLNSISLIHKYIPAGSSSKSTGVNNKMSDGWIPFSCFNFWYWSCWLTVIAYWDNWIEQTNNS